MIRFGGVVAALPTLMPLVPRSDPRAGMFGSRLMISGGVFSSYAISQVRRSTDGISFVQILRFSRHPPPPPPFCHARLRFSRQNASFIVGISSVRPLIHGKWGFRSRISRASQRMELCVSKGFEHKLLQMLWSLVIVLIWLILSSTSAPACYL